MEPLAEAPRASSFIPLVEHQSTTPASFHSGPPVLHYYSDKCRVLVLEEELQDAPILQRLVSQAASAETPRLASDLQGQKAITEVDVWVTSDKLLLYSHSASIGLAIPYPTIALHAIQTLPAPTSTDAATQGVYMQILPSLPSSMSDIEPPETISITILPTASAPPASTAPTSSEGNAVELEDQSEQNPAQALFTALSNCSNLHPDPVDNEDDDDDDERQGRHSRLIHAGLAIPGTSDGSMPPPMPGSGGWITAENMHEFIDKDGNWIERDEDMEEELSCGEQDTALGPGAGTVRSRPDDTNGDDVDEETKWRRTS